MGCARKMTRVCPSAHQNRLRCYNMHKNIVALCSHISEYYPKRPFNLLRHYSIHQCHRFTHFIFILVCRTVGRRANRANRWLLHLYSRLYCECAICNKLCVTSDKHIVVFEHKQTNIHIRHRQCIELARTEGGCVYGKERETERQKGGDG